jgi:PEP-CTERM motif
MNGTTDVADDGLAIDDFSITISPSADFNLDGDVDGGDFLAWQRGVGTNSGASISVGDSNKDGAVDLLDLAVWRKEFAGPPFAATPAAAPAPEPASLMLMAAAATLGMALTRRQDQQRRRQLGYVSP